MASVALRIFTPMIFILLMPTTVAIWLAEPAPHFDYLDIAIPTHPAVVLGTEPLGYRICVTFSNNTNAH